MFRRSVHAAESDLPRPAVRSRLAEKLCSGAVQLAQRDGIDAASSPKWPRTLSREASLRSERCCATPHHKFTASLERADGIPCVSRCARRNTALRTPLKRGSRRPPSKYRRRQDRAGFWPVVRRQRKCSELKSMRGYPNMTGRLCCCRCAPDGGGAGLERQILRRRIRAGIAEARLKGIDSDWTRELRAMMPCG